LRKVFPAHAGRIDAKGRAAADTPIPPRPDFAVLSVPQRPGHFLEQFEMLSITPWMRANLKRLETLRFHFWQLEK
jgi:hypothetical protein